MPTRCCSEYIFRGFYWRVGGGGEGFRGSEIAAKKEERTRKKKTVLGRSFTPDEGKQIARTRLEVFHESHPFFLSLSLSLFHSRTCQRPNQMHFNNENDFVSLDWFAACIGVGESRWVTGLPAARWPGRGPTRGTLLLAPAGSAFKLASQLEFWLKHKTHFG